MARYTRKTTEEKQAALRAREQEQLRSELREFAIREAKKALNDTLRELERDLATSARQSVRSAARSSATAEASLIGGWDMSSLGSSVLGAAIRLFRSNSRTRMEDSVASETSRSQQENQLYRESRSQQEARLAIAARKAQRSL